MISPKVVVGWEEVGGAVVVQVEGGGGTGRRCRRKMLLRLAIPLSAAANARGAKSRGGKM